MSVKLLNTEYLTEVSGILEGRECLILMPPKVDFACNIYKILKEKKECDMDMNSVEGFHCP